MARVDVTVVVDDEHRTEMEDVAAALVRAGMTVDQRLDEMGMLTGSVPAECRSEVEAVPGVVSVSSPLDVQLSPPDADTQ
jgi:hypothetical protein